MAVAYDNSVTVTGSAVGSLTTAAFTISGTDRAYVLCITSDQPGITVSSATCGGVSATSAGTRAANGYWSHLYYGVAPSTGSQTASVTYSDTWGTLLKLTAITFTGVDQTTPVSDYTSATGSTATPSITVSNTTADDMVVDAAAGGGGGTTTVGANQTAVYEVDDNDWGVSYQDGADGGVMSWTWEFSGGWAHAGLRVNAAAAAAASDNRNALLLGVG